MVRRLRRTGLSEQLTDGDCEDPGTPDWASYRSGVLSKSTANPHSGAQALRITENGLNNPGAQGSAIVKGHFYRIKGWARGDGTAVPRVYDGAPLWTGTSSTSWQYFEVTLLAGSTFFLLQALVGVGGANWIEFDDLSIVGA